MQIPAPEPKTPEEMQRMQYLQSMTKTQRNKEHAAFKRAMTTSNPARMPAPDILALWNQV
jgi:hypothetical protein